MRQIKDNEENSETQYFELYHPVAHSPHPDTHHISFAHVLVASVWVVTLHSLFLYSAPPLPCHPPS